MIFLDLALWIAMHEHQPLGNLYQSLLNIWICQLNYDCKNSQMKNLKKKFVLKVELTSEKSSFWLCYSETIEMLGRNENERFFFSMRSPQYGKVSGAGQWFALWSGAVGETECSSGWTRKIGPIPNPLHHQTARHDGRSSSDVPVRARCFLTCNYYEIQMVLVKYPNVQELSNFH